MSFIARSFQEGGWGMWLILFWSVFVFAIIIERALYLVRASVNKDAFLTSMQKSILAGDVRGAIKTCSAAKVPLARIVKAGLVNVSRPDAEVQGAMDQQALRELPMIEKRTGYLSMLSNLAMLSGLLGTVSGLIRSFAAVAGVDPSAKATMLAKGISEAMNCTAFGLIIAISGLIGFALLNGRVQQLVDDINESTVYVLNLIVNNRNKVNMPQQAA
jgi:biopolymer transport protein ExbB